MSANFTTDSGILEYVHRLNNAWLLEHHDLLTKSLNDLGVTEALKNWVEIMHSMSYFVEGLILWDNKISLFVFCILFKKWLHLPGRVKEIGSSIVVLGLKILNLICFNVIIIDNLSHFILQYLN